MAYGSTTGSPDYRKSLRRRKAMFTERVKDEWSEESTGDGYWMGLKPGWTLDDATVIHENTRKRCLDRLPECVFNEQHEAWGGPWGGIRGNAPSVLSGNEVR